MNPGFDAIEFDNLDPSVVPLKIPFVLDCLEHLLLSLVRHRGIP